MSTYVYICYENKAPQRLAVGVHINMYYENKKPQQLDVGVHIKCVARLPTTKLRLHRCAQKRLATDAEESAG